MDPSLYLISFLLMQAAPTPEPQQVFPASVAASLAGGLSRQGDTAHGRAGEGKLAVDWYVRRPVVDDGTPASLQSYLQRADRLSLGVEGSLSSATLDDPSWNELTDRRFAVRLAGLLYRPWAVLGGEVEYSHLSSRLSSSLGSGASADERYHRQFLRPSATVGLRDQTFELRISYIYVAYFDYAAPFDNGALSNVELGAGYVRNPAWGQFMAIGKFVRDDGTYFSLAAFTLADGGGLSAKYEFFPSPRIGIWLAGDYQNEQTNVPDGAGGVTVVGYAMAHGEVGVEWWRSNRFALLGWMSGGMIREILEPRSAYGTETPYLELMANLGIVTRIARRKLNGNVAASSE
jgi:hypothetical protein